jgi:CheY-like chemotaxis protein
MSLVLIVEDDAQTSLLLNKALSAQKHTVLIARNGAEALQICAEQRPDLILLDLRLPVLNGLEFLDLYKQFPEHAPVIGVSADLGMLDAETAKYFVGILSKPFTVTDLYNCIKLAI